jgi:hypothetical protein
MTLRREAPTAAVRIRAMKRDRFRCTYCGVPGTDAELEIDHIIAVSNGGSHHISNLTTACRTCNQLKGSSEGQPPIIRNGTGKRGLIGMCIHRLKDGRINNQGQIIAEDGDMVLVQLYEWFCGSPTVVVPIPKTVIYSEECRIYRDHESMNSAYEIEARGRNSAFDRGEL